MPNNPAAGNSELARAICHEAGHLVIALHFGFRVDRLEIDKGKPLVTCDLDAAERSAQERYLLLTGGIAGEKLGIGNYDPAPCRRDQQQIAERGGESIETYLPEAVLLIESRKPIFDELRKQIMIKVITKSMEMMMVGGENSFRLFSGDEIRQIWNQSGG